MMLDRSDAEAVLFRVAVAAFMYYPEKHIQEPGYSVEEDLEWCAKPMAILPEPTQQDLLDEARAIITDQTRDRRKFIDTVISLSDW